MTNVKVVQEFLKRCGYTRFVTTTDSTQAFAAIEEHCPDLVLLDIHMPEVDGVEILSRIRQVETLINISVLIMTASDDDTLRQQAIELGATDFLPKPIDRYELMPRVRNALLLKMYREQLIASQ